MEPTELFYRIAQIVGNLVVFYLCWAFVRWLLGKPKDRRDDDWY